MTKRLMFFAALAVASFGLIASFGGVAAADTISPSPITFEITQGYATGPINGQNFWSDTGAYDANVASVSSYPAANAYGFGAQALQISDKTTSGSFGDQIFSPGLTQAAGESGQSHFDASFSIGSATGAEQPGMHVSVSPDDGNGGRMSYLRFEDQAGGIDVYFDDVSDPGPLNTVANFTDTKIASLLPYGIAHPVVFSIDFKPGPANDAVTITIDGQVKKVGTTWEDYYRYDPEQAGNGNQVPPTSKLLFREGGSANSGDAGNGYLIDDVSLTSAPCSPTGLMRDGLNLTAKIINPSATVTGTVNASGCNIGVYYGPGKSGGLVSGANISGANYYGVVVNAAADSVSNATIHDIGESPLNGSQHGVGVLYTTVDQAGTSTGASASGTLSGTTITNYQKNGVVVSGPGASVKVLSNTVTGQGPVNYIAQNGVQFSFGASGTATGNTISNDWYTGPTYTACGLLFYQAAGVKQSGNVLSGNQTNLCNAGRGGGNTRP